MNIFLNFLYFLKISVFSEIAHSDIGFIQKFRIWSEFFRWIFWITFVEIAQILTFIRFYVACICNGRTSVYLYRKNFNFFRFQFTVGLCFFNHGIFKTILWPDIFIISNWIFSECCWIFIIISRVSFLMYFPS